MKLRHCHRTPRLADKGFAMIFPLIGMFLGAIFGAWRAKSRDGNRLDMLQWGAVFAILFGIIGLFLVIFLDRSYF